MPRNGSDIYYVLPGTEGFPDTTIESEKYNNYIHDVETDLNRARPIIAGGTGANNANDALLNLGAEKSSQLVTNYAAHVWYPGSFYSLAGATSAPTAPLGQTADRPFVGWVVSSDPPANPPVNQNVVVHARNQNDVSVPGRLYVREKKAGVWGPWAIDGGGIASATPPLTPADGTLWWDTESGQLYIWYRDVDSAAWVIASPSPDPAQFLLKAGDSMTGVLTLPVTPVADTDAANKKYVDDTIQTQGTLLAAVKVDKAGDVMTGNLTIRNSSSPCFVVDSQNGTEADIFGESSGRLRWQLALGDGTAESGGNSGSNFQLNRFNDAGTSYLGTPIHVSRSTGQVTLQNNFVCNGNATAGGNVTVGGSITANGSAVVSGNIDVEGGIFLTNTLMILGGNGIYLRPNGWSTSANQVIVGNSGAINLSAGSFTPPSGVNGGFQCKQGDTNNIIGDYFNFLWSGGSLIAYVDNSNVGTVSLTSDYRTKKDIKPLASMWDAVKALHPIKYSHAAFTPPSEKEQREKENKWPFFPASDMEQWGFVAHELQEKLTKSAASGEKDMPNGLQSPNVMTVIAALTKALQEAMTRIEALEAGAKA